MQVSKLLLTLAGALAVSFSANAATTTTITIGDNDCFGTNAAVCTDGLQLDDGSLTGDFAFFDNSTALDPANMDQYFSGPDGKAVGDPFAVTFALDLTSVTVTSAKVVFKTAGLGNVFSFGGSETGAEVSVNGTSVGFIFDDYDDLSDVTPDSFARINTNEFTVDPATLITGNNVVQFALSGFDLGGGRTVADDDYAVDFVQLIFETEPTVAPVPLPASATLALAAFGLLAGVRRLRRA